MFPTASSPGAADTGTRLDSTLVGLWSSTAVPGAHASSNTPVEQYPRRVLAAVIQLWLVPGSHSGLAQTCCCNLSLAAVSQQWPGTRGGLGIQHLAEERSEGGAGADWVTWWLPMSQPRVRLTIPYQPRISISSQETSWRAAATACCRMALPKTQSSSGKPKHQIHDPESLLGCLHRYSLPIWILISSLWYIISCKPSITSCPGSLCHWCAWQALCCRGTCVSASAPSSIQSLVLNPPFLFLDLQFSLQAFPLSI